MIFLKFQFKKITRLCFLAGVLIINLNENIYAQDKLNLGFEEINPATNTLKNWNTNMSTMGSQGYISGLDSVIKERGKYSLFIEKDTTDNHGMVGACTKHFLVNFKGREVELTGYIKTQNVSRFASIIIQLTENNGKVISNDLKGFAGIRGTTGWKKYSFKVPMDSAAYEIAIIPNLIGNGKAWFDNFKLYVDSVPYDSVHKYDFSPFSIKQQQWLKRNVVLIRSINPRSSLSDLDPVKKIVGNVRIVGLGEFTHGTAEIFTLKHKLIKFLIEKKRFNIIAIEANMADTYNINKYVLTGEGDPKLLLQHLFAQLNNPAMLDLIEWVRKYNKSTRKKVQFIGIDIQSIDDALDYLESFASEFDTTLLARLRLVHKWTTYEDFNEIYTTSVDKIALRKNSTEIYKYIVDNKPIITTHISQKEYAWLKQSAMILVQAQGFLTSFSNEYRDSCMAGNVNWILDQNPESKMILWSHNLHIGNRDYFMGHLLTEKYGSNYLSIGFLGNSGTYTAFRMNNYGRLLTTGQLASDYDGSYEYRFHQVGIPIFILDLRKVTPDNPACNWLGRSMKMRENIGSLIQDNYFLQFRMTNLKQAFDVVIYLDSTHHSNPFKP